MSRKLILALAVLAISFAGASFAAVENIKISGDISTEAVTRDIALGDDNCDAERFLFSQIRLRFDADLTEGVSAVVSLLNERIWGLEDAGNAAGSTELALDLGYVELREFIYEPLTLVAGRQNLRYGNALIIGDPDTNRVACSEVPTAIADLSLRKSFDAVRAILDYAPWTIDLFYAKVDENTVNIDDDETMLGVNATYDWDSYNGVTEVYVVNVDGGSGSDSQVAEDEDNVLTVGARVQLDLNDNLTLGLEGAHQSGDYVSGSNTFHRDAWAAQTMAEYKFLNDYNTKVGVSYTYLTGDEDDTDDNEYQAWDPVYESQTPGEIINMLLTNSNVQLISASASCMPQEDITLGLVYTHAQLNEQLSSITGAGAVAGKTYTMRDKKDFGDEVDAYAVYDYTEDVQLKLNAALFLPGGAFDKVNDNTAYSLRGGMVVSF